MSIQCSTVNLDDFFSIFNDENIDCLKALIEDQPSLINKKDLTTGLTFLYLAVMSGQYQLTEYLLEKSADPNAICNGKSALHKAVENGNYKLINLLLVKGANPNIQQANGETPIHIAAGKGEYTAMKQLLSFKADPWLLTFKGDSPLDYAKDNNHLKCIEVLMKNTQSRHSRNSTLSKAYSYNKDSHDYGDKWTIINEKKMSPYIERSKTQNIFRDDLLEESLENGENDNIPQTNNWKLNLFPSYLNYSNLANAQKSKKFLKSSLVKPDPAFTEANISSYTFNFEGNRQVTFQRPEVDETVENMQTSTNDKANSKMTHSTSQRGLFSLLGGYSYISNPNEESTNVIQAYFQRTKNHKSNPIRNSTYSFSYDNRESRNEYLRCSEYYPDEGKIFNKVMSAQSYIKEEQQEMNKHICENLRKAECDKDENVKNQESIYEECIEEEFVENAEDVEVEGEGEGEANLDTEENHFKARESIAPYIKQISLDTQNINKVSSTDSCKGKADQIDNNNSGYDSSNSNEIFDFLNQIGLAKYTSLMIKQGLHDVKLLIKQINTRDGITDKMLKDAGIVIPGHRAKILIKLEEDSKNFNFEIPRDDVYYSAGCEETQTLMNDHHVKSIDSWLGNLKMELYTINFIHGGYHSLELLLMQMRSKNPLTEKILEEDIKISKIGYRKRILNNLKDDSRTFIYKLKSTGLEIDNKNEENIEACRCLIF